MDFDQQIRRENFKRYALQCGLAGVTRTAHPPALTLRLALDEWNLLTLVVVLFGVITLSLIKQLVLPMLLELI